jgi:hypothetical protein
MCSIIVSWLLVSRIISCWLLYRELQLPKHADKIS